MNQDGRRDRRVVGVLEVDQADRLALNRSENKLSNHYNAMII